MSVCANVQKKLALQAEAPGSMKPLPKKVALPVTVLPAVTVLPENCITIEPPTISAGNDCQIFF
ncbi:hypothetical protein [Moorena producens]|uniref:hypothetical protein n=1 Tax=Moorena producens TaxID=1155739 RepID=UPI003C761131